MKLSTAHSQLFAKIDRARVKKGIHDTLYTAFSGLVFGGLLLSMTYQPKLDPKFPIIDPHTHQVAISDLDLLDTPLDVRHPKVEYKNSTWVVKEVYAEEAKVIDRVAVLKEYLTANHSPLAPYAELIVAEADQHGLDYTKIVAISKAESTFGKYCPEGSHNAWGITVNSKEGTIRYFASWEEGIMFVSKLLGDNYKYNENAGIRAKYCPTVNCAKTWADTVTDTTHEIISLAESK